MYARMLKYLKEIFRGMFFAQGQQFVNRDVQTIDTEKMDCPRIPPVRNDHGEAWSCSGFIRDTTLFFKKMKMKKESSERQSEPVKESRSVPREPVNDSNDNNDKINRHRHRCCCRERSRVVSKKDINRESVAPEEKKTYRRRMGEKPRKDVCRCENCSVVANFNECAICLESLVQKHGVRTCPVCANIVCSRCANKLKICPYCRSTKPMEKNRTVDKLLQKLFLPCNNFEYGCRKLVNSDTRSKHESTCSHTPIYCPASDDCCWKGTAGSMVEHLKKDHDLHPIEHNGLAIEIPSFREQSMSKEGGYKIFLSCHGQIFMIELTLCKKLRLSFTQIGYAAGSSEKSREKNYRAWLKMTIAGKRVRAILPIEKINGPVQRTRPVYKTLLSEQQNIFDKDHAVKIDIFIQEIKET